MISVARKFLGHVVPGVLRPLRVLWNEVIGFMFLVLAVMFASSGFKLVREYDGGAESIAKLVAAGAFVLLLAGFGIQSFLKARRISRS